MAPQQSIQPQLQFQTRRQPKSPNPTSKLPTTQERHHQDHAVQLKPQSQPLHAAVIASVEDKILQLTSALITTQESVETWRRRARLLGKEARRGLEVARSVIRGRGWEDVEEVEGLNFNDDSEGVTEGNRMKIQGVAGFVGDVGLDLNLDVEGLRMLCRLLEEDLEKLRRQLPESQEKKGHGNMN